MQRRSLCLLMILLGIPLLSRAQGKFSGLTYFDFYYNVARPSTQPAPLNMAATGAKDMQSFQIRRLFFTYDDELSKEFATKLRVDADQSALTTDGRITFYLKDASLTWNNIFRGSHLSLGLIPTLPFEVIESVWGYRVIEKTMMDLRGLVSTRDMGVSLRGKIDEEGIVEYGLQVGDNSASKPASTRYRRYYGQFIVRPARGLVLAAYGDYNDRSTVGDPYNLGTRVGNGVLTVDGLLGFVELERFSVGVEVSNATAFHGYDNGVSLTNLQSLGVSGFGSVNVMRDLALVGRFDYFDPNINTNVRGDSRNYAMAGISWKPMVRVSIIPNILYETYEQLPNGTKPTASVTARMTVYYVFP